uniref:G_PROTEIN_RECEP_F1_2 domain-containing protein n=1 Tax=Steinernema glaseri TaxID=37863 RepID=A0A1I8A1A8_9BILA
MNSTVPIVHDLPTDSKERTWEDRRDDFIVVSVWLLMLSYALISNILILIGIARSSTMRTATSYWFIISLAICDIVMTIISLVHLVPATAFHSAYVELHAWRNIIMIFFYDLFWYTAVLQLGLMACNRFVSIVYPMEYKWLFSKRRSVLTILFGYILGFLVSLPTLFKCCHTLWKSDLYVTVYDPMDTWYKYVDMSVNSLSLVMMIMSYAVIIYKVRESGKAMAKYQLTIRTRQQAQAMNGSASCSRSYSVRPPRSQVSKKEMRLFIQFFVVSLVFLLTWTTWQWLPHISGSKWAYFVMTSLFFINNSVNPTVYLLFNTQLRRELHYLLCRQSTVSTVETRRKHTQMNRDGPTNNNDPTTTVNGGSCGLMVAAHDISLGGHNHPSSHSSGSVDYSWERFHKRFLVKNGHASLLNPVDISEV